MNDNQQHSSDQENTMQDFAPILDKAVGIYDSVATFDVAGNGSIVRSIFFNEQAVSYCLGILDTENVRPAIIKYVRNYIDQQGLLYQDLSSVHFFVNPRRSMCCPGEHYLEVAPSRLMPILNTVPAMNTLYPGYPRTDAYPVNKVPPNPSSNESPCQAKSPSESLFNGSGMYNQYILDNNSIIKKTCQVSPWA